MYSITCSVTAALSVNYNILSHPTSREPDTVKSSISMTLNFLPLMYSVDIAVYSSLSDNIDSTIIAIEISVSLSSSVYNAIMIII